MTNKEINGKAALYAALDPVADSARRLSIRDEIWGYEYMQIKEREGRAVGGLPRLVGYNDTIDIDVFIATFQNVMVEIFSKFDPDKGAAFTTMLGQRLRQRLTTEYEKDKRFKERVPMAENAVILDDGKETTVIDMQPDPESEFPDYRSEFEIFCALAPLVANEKEIDSHRGKNGRSYFEGFYTFDAVAQTKNGTFTENEIVSENELLFPIMERVVLGYLLDGEFTSMGDIARNPTRDAKLLTKRQEAMMVCYKISDTTVGTKNKRYVKLILSLGE